MNLTDLKAIMQQVIDVQLDHKFLDRDVDFFKIHPRLKCFTRISFISNLYSTAENVAVFIWQEILRLLPSNGVALYEVRVRETDKNMAIYRGE